MPVISMNETSILLWKGDMRRGNFWLFLRKRMQSFCSWLDRSNVGELQGFAVAFAFLSCPGDLLRLSKLQIPKSVCHQTLLTYP